LIPLLLHSQDTSIIKTTTKTASEIKAKDVIYDGKKIKLNGDVIIDHNLGITYV